MYLGWRNAHLLGGLLCIPLILWSIAYFQTLYPQNINHEYYISSKSDFYTALHKLLCTEQTFITCVFSYYPLMMTGVMVNYILKYTDAVYHLDAQTASYIALGPYVLGMLLGTACFNSLLVIDYIH